MQMFYCRNAAGRAWGAKFFRPGLRSRPIMQIAVGEVAWAVNSGEQLNIEKAGVFS
jgi:hypothetical protein